MHRNFKIAAIAAVASLAAGAAVAQSGEALINQLLEKADEIVNTQRKASVETTVRNALPNRTQKADTVRLRGGDYVIVGVCDQDCTDFDLVVRDTGGSEIGSDRLDDDFPTVSLNGLAAGSYQIQSEMPGCGSDPCLTAVRVYRLQ